MSIKPPKKLSPTYVNEDFKKSDVITITVSGQIGNCPLAKGAQRAKTYRGLASIAQSPLSLLKKKQRERKKKKKRRTSFFCHFNFPRARKKRFSNLCNILNRWSGSWLVIDDPNRWSGSWLVIDDPNRWSGSWLVTDECKYVGKGFLYGTLSKLKLLKIDKIYIYFEKRIYKRTWFDFHY